LGKQESAHFSRFGALDGKKKERKATWGEGHHLDNTLSFVCRRQTGRGKGRGKKSDGREKRPGGHNKCSGPAYHVSASAPRIARPKRRERKGDKVPKEKGRGKKARLDREFSVVSEAIGDDETEGRKEKKRKRKKTCPQGKEENLSLLQFRVAAVGGRERGRAPSGGGQPLLLGQ